MGKRTTDVTVIRSEKGTAMRQNQNTKTSFPCANFSIIFSNVDFLAQFPSKSSEQCFAHAATTSTEEISTVSNFIKAGVGRTMRILFQSQTILIRLARSTLNTTLSHSFTYLLDVCIIFFSFAFFDETKFKQ